MSDLAIPTGDSFESEPTTVRAADRELALDDLFYLNRMTTVGQVLPNVAHELNNALQVISGIVEILSIKTGLPVDVSDKVGRIGAQTARASDMIRDLVVFARHDDGGVNLIDVMRTIERALAFRRYHLARARITVAVEGPGNGLTRARLDGSYLHQILLNLIINAEHSLAGRSDGRIRITVTRAGDTMEIRLADNGDGVPADVAARMTEPFFTTKGTAAGLGLTVAAGLARALAGTLQLENAPDGGAQAVLRFPTT
jgi:C4-dicarboxylate-specific signal transduction histidine kinase